MEVISSPQNPRIKQLRTLSQKARERKLSGLFVVEGIREIEFAQSANYQLETLFVCPQIYTSIENLPNAKQTFEVSPSVFEKVAYRPSTEGLIAVARQKNLKLSEIKTAQNSFYIVLEAVEKPGNLGAILRTADAAQVTAVIVCDAQCDIYNPNIVRSSIGCLFTQQIVCCSSEEAFKFLTVNKVNILAAELQATEYYHKVDMRKSTAIIMGTESDGLTDFWINKANQRIKIPMCGEIDSLNVSVSTAVLTFEAMRQRNFNNITH
ncbi:MAG: TrmH family RNA methyltransferase [Bacteroidales bacterium]